uniref:Uncharacterized protein n=1 Tax=Arundo donax TaxID=35708 RepID=A0A0A9E1D9_ARUDO
MDGWGINSWETTDILCGNIRTICMYINPNCKYNTVKTKTQRPCMTSCLFCFPDFSDYRHCLRIWELENGKPNTLVDVRNSERAVCGSYLLAQIPEKALHCSMYIPSSSD